MNTLCLKYSVYQDVAMDIPDDLPYYVVYIFYDLIFCLQHLSCAKSLKVSNFQCFSLLVFFIASDLHRLLLLFGSYIQLLYLCCELWLQHYKLSSFVLFNAFWFDFYFVISIANPVFLLFVCQVYLCSFFYFHCFKGLLYVIKWVLLF